VIVGDESQNPVVLVSFLEITLEQAVSPGQLEEILSLTTGFEHETPVHTALLLYRARAMVQLRLSDAAIETFTLALRRRGPTSCCARSGMTGRCSSTAWAAGPRRGGNWSGSMPRIPASRTCALGWGWADTGTSVIHVDARTVVGDSSRSCPTVHVVARAEELITYRIFRTLPGEAAPFRIAERSLGWTRSQRRGRWAK
jgi:hypothetical protein